MSECAEGFRVGLLTLQDCYNKFDTFDKSLNAAHFQLVEMMGKMTVIIPVVL